MKRNQTIILILLLVFCSALCGISIYSNTDSLHLVEHSAITMDEGWLVVSSKGEIQNQTLPLDLHLKANESYTLSRSLPLIEEDHDWLLLRSSMQSLKVFVENILIYDGTLPPKSSWDYTYASVWNVIPLQPSFSGKNITIEVKTPIASFSGKFNPIFIGGKDVLLYQIYETHWVHFVISGILFVAGLIMLVFSFFIKMSDDSRLFYLGLLSISASIWILSEARVLQLFMGNRFIIGAISYMMIPLMAIFLSAYFKEAIYVLKGNQKLMQWIAYVNVLLLLLMLFLQFLGISYYIHMMQWIFAIIIIEAVLSVILMVYEKRKYNNQVVYRIMKYMILLILSIVAESICFYFTYFSYTSFFLSFGLLLFFILLVKDYCIHFQEYITKKKEQYILEKWAFKDFLTGGNNRTAFERDIQKKLNQPFSNFRLILADINNLKDINDKYGHVKGDEAIRKVYQVVEEVFEDIGICYRIGGDEIAIIVQNVNDDNITVRKAILSDILCRESNYLEYSLSLAVGTGVYANDGSCYSSFYNKVDQDMYCDKLKQKEDLKQ